MPSNSVADWLQSAYEDPSETNVHRLRTSIRRCEGVIRASAYSPSRKDRQVLKRLKKVRRAAGEVRDLDIHLALLKSEELQQASLCVARQQVETILAAARRKAEKNLTKELEKASANNVAKQAQKLCARGTKYLPADIASNIDKQLRTIACDAKLDDAEVLHAVRIQLKRIRYALESRDDEALKPTIDSLKVVHDAIGAWHDWTTLADIAAEHLPRRSGLVVNARRHTVSLFVKALEEAERFLAPYKAARNRPVSATARPESARAHA